MASVNVSAKNPGTDRTATVEFDFGSTLAEAIELFGEEAIYAGFIADAKVGLQAVIRTKLKSTKEDGSAYTDEDIAAAASEWAPGNKTRTASDPLAKLQALLSKLSPEQRAAILSKAAE